APASASFAHRGTCTPGASNVRHAGRDWAWACRTYWGSGAADVAGGVVRSVPGVLLLAWGDAAQNPVIGSRSTGPWSSFGQVETTKRREAWRSAVAQIRTVDTAGERWRSAAKVLA